MSNIRRLSGPPRLRIVPPVNDDHERWHWPSFGWGVWTGIYVGCLGTVGMAWLWSFFL